MLFAVAQVPPIPTPTPIVSPQSESLPGPALSERSVLSDRIDQIVAAAKSKTGGTLGVVVWDLGTNVLVQQNAEQALPMASVFKLAVAFAAYDAVDHGKLHLDQRVTVQPGDLVSNVSRIADEYEHGPRAFALHDLLDRMLIESDNTAADVLYRMLGGPDVINGVLHGAGIDAIVIRTNEAGNAANAKSGKSFAQGADNAGSPAAIALLLSELTKGRLLSQASRNAFFETLAKVNTFNGRLRAGLPPNTRLRHKTGTSGSFGDAVDATNDVGIATINGRDVVIVAMLQGARGDGAQRDAILASVARAAYDATRLFPL